MAVFEHHDFTPSRKYRHAHYSTFIPSLFGKEPEVPYERKRVETPDGDFLDLDYLRNGHNRVAILCHGLEGDSRSVYVLLQAEHLMHEGWDILSINYRGCSGETNRHLQMYSSGATRDLYFVIDEHTSDYDEVTLIGFSLGGNLVLKYAGEHPDRVNSRVSSVVGISTPLDHLRKCYNLYQFDEYYTAPVWGYSGAKDYYDSNASIQWLHQIEIPALVINAKNDPFLGPKCYPKELVSTLPFITLLTPEYGGHCGFAYSRDNRTWMLDHVARFVDQKIEQTYD